MSINKKETKIFCVSINNILNIILIVFNTFLELINKSKVWLVIINISQDLVPIISNI